MSNPLHDALFAPQAGRDAPFLALPDGGTVTHAAFCAQAARIAGALRAAGLAPGDRLAAQVPKSPAALALYAACVQAGVVFLPLNPAYTDAETRYFVEDAEARMLVCAPERADALAGLSPALRTLGADGSGTLTAAAEGLPARAAPVPRAPDDIAALLYTSGTTGRAKGAMLTHDNLLSNARALTALWRFTEADVLLHALPIFHTHGLFVATNVTLLAGGAMLFLPGFEVGAVLGALPRATAMMGVPTFYTRLLDDPRLTRAATAHMRLFVSGSAPLPEEVHARFAARTGHAILERYGMTETSMIASNPCDGPRRAGTVGLPLPGVEMRLVDPATGTEVAPGAVGAIEVRGAGVFRGYWRMPEKTAAEFRADGFFVTGDLGTRDAEGYLRIVGRDKDVIITGGFNVYPREIETLLDAQAGVRESAVIGVPHPDFGETPLALVVPEPGAAPEADALRAALAAALARYKHPREVLFVDALPRNAMGKVQKAALRARHRARFLPA